MAYFTKQSATQIADTDDTTEDFFDRIVGPFKSGEIAHIQVVMDMGVGAPAPTGATGCLASLYATLDDSTENWSTRPVASFRSLHVDNSVATVDFTVTGFYRLRIGVIAQVGQLITADMSFRLDQVELGP